MNEVPADAVSDVTMNDVGGPTPGGSFPVADPVGATAGGVDSAELGPDPAAGGVDGDGQPNPPKVPESERVVPAQTNERIIVETLVEEVHELKSKNEALLKSINVLEAELEEALSKPELPPESEAIEVSASEKPDVLGSMFEGGEQILNLGVLSDVHTRMLRGALGSILNIKTAVDTYAKTHPDG